MAYDKSAQNKEGVSVVGIALLLLALLVYICWMTPSVVHRGYLPYVKAQACAYAVTGIDAYEKECRDLTAVNGILNQEVAKNKGRYKGVTSQKIWEVTGAVATITLITTKVLVGLFILAMTLPAIKVGTAIKNRLYSIDENIQMPASRGVEGFIQVVGKHLPAEIIGQLRSDPSPANIGRAFAMVRERINLPNANVARIFPAGSDERLELLEYGKTRVVYDRDEYYGGLNKEAVDER